MKNIINMYQLLDWLGILASYAGMNVFVFCFDVSLRFHDRPTVVIFNAIMLKYHNDSINDMVLVLPHKHPGLT